MHVLERSRVRSSAVRTCHGFQNPRSAIRARSALLHKRVVSRDVKSGVSDCLSMFRRWEEWWWCLKRRYQAYHSVHVRPVCQIVICAPAGDRWQLMRLFTRWNAGERRACILAAYKLQYAYCWAVRGEYISNESLVKEHGRRLSSMAA